MEKFQFLDQIDRRIPLGNRRVVMLTNGEMYGGIVAGDYRLFDNSASYHLERGKICGIYIDESHYIVLNSLMKNKKPKSLKKAVFELCGTENLPTRSVLQILQDNLPAILHSLSQCGMNIEIPQDVCQSFWSREDADEAEKNKRATRRIIEIRSDCSPRDFPKSQDWNNSRKTMFPARLDGFSFARQTFSEPCWILQEISPCCFHVLDEQVRFDPFQENSPEASGSVYFKGKTLVVENPISITGQYSDQGTINLRVRRTFFAKDENGLFQKIEQKIETKSI